MAVTPTFDIKGVTITAPTGTAGNVADLAQAVDAAFPLAANFLLIQVDPANTASTYVYFGDASVSTSRWGAKLGPGDSITFGTDKLSRTRLSGMFVVGSTSGLKFSLLSVEGSR